MHCTAIAGMEPDQTDSPDSESESRLIRGELTDVFDQFPPGTQTNSNSATVPGFGLFRFPSELPMQLDSKHLTWSPQKYGKST